MDRYVGINKESVDSDDIEGNVVIYSLETDSFVELETDASKFLWSLIDGKKTLREIISLMQDEFEVSEEQLLKDMEQFLSEFDEMKAFSFSKSPLV